MGAVGNIPDYLNQGGPNELGPGLVVNFQPSDVLGAANYILGQFTGNVPEALALAQQAIGYVAEVATFLFPPAGIILEVVNLLIDIGEIIAGLFGGTPDYVKTEQIGERLMKSGDKYVHQLGLYVYNGAKSYDRIFSRQTDIYNYFSPAIKDTVYATKMNASGFNKLLAVIYQGDSLTQSFPGPGQVLTQGGSIEHGPVPKFVPPGKLRALETGWLRYCLYGLQHGATLAVPYTPVYPVPADIFVGLQSWENIPRMFALTLPQQAKGPMLAGDIAMLSTQWLTPRTVSDLFTSRGILYRAILDRAIQQNPNVGEHWNTTIARLTMDDIPSYELNRYWNNERPDQCHLTRVATLDDSLKNPKDVPPPPPAGNLDNPNNPNDPNNPENPNMSTGLPALNPTSNSSSQANSSNTNNNNVNVNIQPDSQAEQELIQLLAQEQASGAGSTSQYLLYAAIGAAALIAIVALKRGKK